MPLFIRDPEVAAMAEELARLTRTRSKTAAVRAALRAEIDRARHAVPLAVRLEALQGRAAALCLPNPDFDMKAFSDALWGEG